MTNATALSEKKLPLTNKVAKNICLKTKFHNKVQKCVIYI